MQLDTVPKNIKEILRTKKAAQKPPAYQWQELALRVIGELGVPNKKRSAVFKICKENNKNFIERCLNDTKELCRTGQCWKYFFKLISAKN